jgi:PHP-associated/PHP domain
VYTARAVNVDLHTHTYPASTCSSITYGDYVTWCAEHDVEAVALTNHGNVDDNRKLDAALAAEGVLLIHGVEISTLFGDFVVFSPDLDYLGTLRDVQDPLRPADVPADAAVVWVHPLAGGGRSGSAYFPGLEKRVAPTIHAVEVLNGNWLDRRYVHGALAIAADLGLPSTGGSDGHVVSRLMSCYTEIDGSLSGTADLVTALRAGSVRPGRRPDNRSFGRFRGGRD